MEHLWAAVSMLCKETYDYLKRICRIIVFPIENISLWNLTDRFYIIFKSVALWNLYHKKIVPNYLFWIETQGLSTVKNIRVWNLTGIMETWSKSKLFQLKSVHVLFELYFSSQGKLFIK